MHSVLSPRKTLTSPNTSHQATNGESGYQGASLHRPPAIPPLTAYSFTRFTGSAGQAIISKTSAYLITDSRYWLQAEDQLDKDQWHLIPAGAPDAPRDWVEWLIVRPIIPAVIASPY
jgi:hypothetical protein